MAQRYRAPKGTATSNGSEAGNRALQRWVESGLKWDKNEDYCIDWLKDKYNVAAVHPDDGWVNRDEHSIRLVYPPYREDEIKPGDNIALGFPTTWSNQAGEFRVVKVKSLKESCSARYMFEQISPTFTIMEDGTVNVQSIDTLKELKHTFDTQEQLARNKGFLSSLFNDNERSAKEYCDLSSKVKAAISDLEQDRVSSAKDKLEVLHDELTGQHDSLKKNSLLSWIDGSRNKAETFAGYAQKVELAYQHI